MNVCEMKKVAIVTGSSRGIGFGIAKGLYDKSYHVIVNSSSYKPETEEKFKEAFCDSFTYIYGDIKSETTWNLLLDTAKKLGRLDLLVNNAGIAPPVRTDLLEVGYESFDLVLNTNLRPTFFLTQMCSKYMIEQKQSGAIQDFQPRIVNIGSVSSYASSTNRAEYCISKAGVSMVTILFADRLSEYDIPVFEIRPGIIETDMTSKVKEKYDKLIAEGSASPTRRWGKPKDIAAIISAVSDGAFDFSTGQVFNADGGFHIRRL